ANYAEATDNINNHTAVLPLTLALSRREREPSGWRLGPCKRSAAGQDIRHGILDFAGWRRTPYPAYKPKSPRVLGLLKLPVLAASTSLRRSRQAGAARMDAG
ncbi:TPA: hypothetical protein MB356_005247, partial [Klebsiella variicola subsp. variicola]